MSLEMSLFIVKQNVLEAQKRSRATSDNGVCHLDLSILQLSVLVRKNRFGTMTMKFLFWILSKQMKKD